MSLLLVRRLTQNVVIKRVESRRHLLRYSQRQSREDPPFPSDFIGFVVAGTFLLAASVAHNNGDERMSICRLEGPNPSSPTSTVPSEDFEIDDFYEMSGELLGEGAYGRVYRARRKSDGTPVALKEISISEDTDQDEFEREIAALAKLSQNGGHPNVCRLFGVHRSGKINYVAMEIIDGGEVLEHLILSGPYSEQVAAKFVRELAEAVSYIHGANIVHADLKCENLMLSSWEDEKAKLKVVDFGCAVTTDCKGLGQGIKDFRGTAAYCAPERLKDDIGLPTLASDMFAVGVITYILLTGSHPFDPRGDMDDEAMETLIMSLTADEKGEKLLDALAFDQRVEILSESSKRLIKRLMHPDPTKRMNAEELVVHPWVQGLEASWTAMEGSDEKLQRFWQKSFREAILRKYAKKTDGEQKTLSDSNLKLIFHSIDEDNNGRLDPHELRVALRKLGVADDNCSLMIASVDVDKSGGVDWEEFKQLMRQSFDEGPGVQISNRKLFKTAIMAALSDEGSDDDLPTDESRLRRIFSLIDIDGNGILSYEELSTFLRRLGTPMEEIVYIIETEIDLKNRSGGVTWEEFKSVCEKAFRGETIYKYKKKTNKVFATSQ